MKLVVSDPRAPRMKKVSYFSEITHVALRRMPRGSRRGVICVVLGRFARVLLTPPLTLLSELHGPIPYSGTRATTATGEYDHVHHVGVRGRGDVS